MLGRLANAQRKVGHGGPGDRPMLGKLKPQRKLLAAAAQLGADVVDQMGFYGRLARAAHKIFRDEDFAELYCPDNGRPSVPPSVLATARLLQVYEGISEREVVNRTRFDLRWKVALELDTFSIAPAFARSTYQAFWVRLTLHEKEGLLFEKSVKAARDAGLLPKRVRAALDSTPVRGRGAVKDTFNLLSDAIVAVVRAVARKTGKKVGEVAESAGVERHLEEPSIKGSELVDWEDKESVSTFLGGLVDDC
jgi:transposase